MLKEIKINETLGDIVLKFPEANEIFNKYKIDYCCGGNDPLDKAVNEKGLQVNEFLDELNKAYEKFFDSGATLKKWEEEDPIDLINHIVSIHHIYTKKELPILDGLIFKILKVHFDHHGEELLKIHKLFGLLKVDIQEHLIKEEEILFPLIEAYVNTKDESLLIDIKKFIQETEDEHHAAGDILKELREITNDYQAPFDVCTTYKLVYSKLQDLEQDLFTHIHLENSVLFKII
ncbi:iron-sulfur cluster repair di-iron protein [Clostridium polyendosporum]|uniref:Iron-sulfur cluster repair di-iron protein n=1 Tax=Clostridium polyendosporum TaxID=69208 RepID=A0A919RX69_9CLOT|nr:iron-sulfur cluster repair di-iron protein [Clostridium polyendosporum]GIM27424.1 iron-sulfur cluster repair di-iron protein [Clostridium polyendosporum]